MKNPIKTGVLVLAFVLALSSCNTGNTTKEPVSAETDTVLMDTPMTTGTGTDTLIKENVDGTGKPNTDPRNRKQQ